MNDLIHSVATALNAKRSGTSYVAKCPICNNDKYTLNIWLGDDGKIGLRCYYSVLGRCHTIAHVYYLQSLGVDIDQNDLTGSKNKPSETWPEIWTGAKPIRGTPVDEYLFRRNIDISLIPTEITDKLRFIPYFKHPTGPRLPIMIGLMQNAWDGHDQAIHRTYLNPLGTNKADVIPNKMTLGDPKGGVIKFSEPVNGIIALGEGIETCLSAYLMFGYPVWCATAVGRMLEVRFPSTVKEVFWLIDNDEPGLFTFDCAKKHYTSVRILPMFPHKGYKDFNNELMGQ